MYLLNEMCTLFGIMISFQHLRQFLGFDLAIVIAHIAELGPTKMNGGAPRLRYQGEGAPPKIFSRRAASQALFTSIQKSLL